MKNQLNGIQKFGLILALIGVLFLLFPRLIGNTAILLFAGFIMTIGVYLLVKSFKLGSVFLSALCIGLVVVGLVIFLNPGIILFVVGIGCMMSGLGDFLYLLANPDRKWARLIYPVVLILIGVYATFNSSAAITTIVLILGFVLLVLGGLMIIRGKEFINITKQTPFRYTGAKPYNQQQRKTKQDDDIIDVDYRERD
ncbi:DUF308 domain-containing protein [Vallitalea okinawensis]|uniref:DUF308 domain-containing protein n=1 Tax=Vallitalea okinawensis TaxID=2078660 RepID=UPI000CFB34BB|nr:DUF308 domain-containing protein [Vallitalea okinawensis]